MRKGAVWMAGVWIVGVWHGVPKHKGEDLGELVARSVVCVQLSTVNCKGGLHVPC